MLRLPPEILWLIIQQCSFEDLSNLRVTCQRINKACLDSLKKRLATHCVALERRSIQNLTMLANNEEVGSYVKHLVISTAHLPESLLEVVPHDHVAQYKSLRKVQKNFVSSRLAQEELRAAVRGLKGCVSITLTDENHKIPRDITRMLTDGLGLEPQDGDDMLSTYEDRKFVKHALYAASAAFSASCATDLIINVGESCRCFDDFRIKHDDCEPGDGLPLELVMKSMERFDLSDNFRSKQGHTALKLTFDSHGVSSDDPFDNPDIAYGLETFLSCCNISRLSICCNGVDLSGILSRLARLYFPGLGLIALRGMMGTRQDVLGILKNHRSLKLAEFRNIGLEAPGWGDLRTPAKFRASCHIRIDVCYDDSVDEFCAYHIPEAVRRAPARRHKKHSSVFRSRKNQFVIPNRGACSKPAAS